MLSYIGAEYQPKLKQGLSENCIRACSSAKATILALCERAHGGKVSVNELNIIGTNLNQILELFQASSSIEKEQKFIALTELEAVIKDRREECDTFLYYQTILKHLCRHIALKDSGNLPLEFLNFNMDVYNISGSTVLNHELDRYYGEVNLNSLCARDAKTKRIQLVCFKSAGTLLIFVEGFFILSQKHGSELFATFWREAMSTAIKDNPDLMLDSIYFLVWQPCLDKCKQLLMSLSDLSMKLVDVDVVFKDHKENINTQLYALFKGVSDCTREQFDWRLMERAIGKIKQYWDLCRYRNGANIFLRIRDSLGLGGGDFSLVEKLSKEVI